MPGARPLWRADQGIPVTDVEKMQAACKAAGKICEIKIYPDTPHGFNADYRPSYHAEAAKDGWARMLAWFRSTGSPEFNWPDAFGYRCPADIFRRGLVGVRE